MLGSAMVAVVSTALAEILGAGIALAMLFGIPVKIGAALAAVFVLVMLETNSYRYLERWLIGFVSLIGLAFLYELTLVHVPWGSVAAGWVTPSIPAGSMPLLMSVLGAVVMPHNIFLHSEIIQSRRWDREDEATIRHQLKFEMFDTMTSMVIGWLINSAMIIVAAAVFFAGRIRVDDLAQAEAMLRPILGRAAGVVFAVALLAAGLAAAVTAGMTGATIAAGVFGKPYDMKDRRSRAGAAVSILGALVVVFFPARHVPGADRLADAPEHPAPDHGLHPDRPDLLPQGHGPLRQHPIQPGLAARRGRPGRPVEHPAPARRLEDHLTACHRPAAWARIRP